VTPRYDVSAWRLPWHFVRSAVMAVRHRELLDTVERHCFFLGFPKSGHSLVGSLLDAHPDIVIAHELAVLKYLLAGFSRRQIDWLSLENSCRLARSGRRERHNVYDVPGQWQGRYERLRVVGDKHGEGMTLRLRARPWLLEKLQGTLFETRLVFVVRNPYDIIASLTVPRSRRLDLASASDYFFTLCDTVTGILRCVDPETVLPVRHEDLVQDPPQQLRKLCSFLAVEAGGSYLDACSQIVFDVPRTTRTGVAWPSDLVRAVQRRSMAFPFLAGYAFEGRV
jgi:hypothetical protein